MSEQTDVYATAWHEVLTSTHEVEPAINSLIREAGRVMQIGAAARARYFNLVVVVDESTAAHAADVLNGLSHSHPSRCIVLRTDAENPSAGVSVVPSIRCHIEGEDHYPVVFEQVDIEARGGAVLHLAGTLAPVLDSDQPVLLWWIGDPPVKSERFQRVADLADRIIVDSRRIEDATALKAIANAHRTGEAEFCDLTWGRLTSWREQIARGFDSPAMLPYLSQVTSVEIVYAGHSAPALLLLGWLGSRLNWQVAQSMHESPALAPGLGRRQRATGRRGTGDIALSIQQMHGEAGILAVNIAAGDMQLSVARLAQKELVLVTQQRPGQPQTEQVAPMHDFDEAALLNIEITHSGRDYGYEAALEFAANVAAS